MNAKFVHVIHDVRSERMQTSNETSDLKTSNPEADSCDSDERKI